MGDYGLLTCHNQRIYKSCIATISSWCLWKWIFSGTQWTTLIWHARYELILFREWFFTLLCFTRRMKLQHESAYFGHLQWQLMLMVRCLRSTLSLFYSYRIMQLVFSLMAFWDYGEHRVWLDGRLVSLQHMIFLSTHQSSIVVVFDWRDPYSIDCYHCLVLPSCITWDMVNTDIGGTTTRRISLSFRRWRTCQLGWSWCQ